MTDRSVLSVEISNIPLVKEGKVREVYSAGDHFLIVATDRISAFDCIMPNGIPGKGRVLTGMSAFWFDRFRDLVENHLLSTDLGDAEEAAGVTLDRKDILEGRIMLVRKTEPLPIECVVRGYLAGSGWKEYKERGSICDIPLPGGLRESDRLPGSFFTPSTKAEEGHDLNIHPDEAAEMIGRETFEFVSRTSIEIYTRAAEYARERGIIVADTKFEFGRVGEDIILIDEVLTPDSSRFWPLDEYEPGRPQRSYDKQFVRDYLETTGWDKTPPAPPLPDEVVEKTAGKYLEAQRLLLGA